VSIVPSDTSGAGQLTIPIADIDFDASAWARIALHDERVELFCQLVRDGVALPRPEVVAAGPDRWFVADGVHRITAQRDEGKTEIAVSVIAPQAGETPLQCAFRRSVETASHAAQPLTRAERTRTVKLLVTQHPDWSDQTIADLCGVARQTVWRHRNPRSNATLADAFEALRNQPTFPSARDIAADFVGRLVELKARRGLLDHLNPQRMGKHLGRAFSEQFGEDALDEARRFTNWMHAMIVVLEREAEMS
jgi:hypothetical protein